MYTVISDHIFIFIFIFGDHLTPFISELFLYISIISFRLALSDISFILVILQSVLHELHCGSSFFH